LGYITKVHGIKGELVFYLVVDQPSLFPKLEEVLIELNEELISYPLKEYKLIPKNQAIVKLENINSIEAAQPFVRKQLFLPLDLLPASKGNNLYYHEVTGFDVVDKNEGSIGKVTNVSETAAGILIEVLFNSKEILIPANEEILEKIDKENKTIYVNCPDGLIAIYLHKQSNEDRDDD